MLLELPHTAHCIVCGRGNPHGLQLSLHVDPQTGIVSTTFAPTPDHVGFEGIIHGGVLAAVLDEAMVWAATWNGKRFCVCAELTTRFKESAWSASRSRSPPKSANRAAGSLRRPPKSPARTAESSRRRAANTRPSRTPATAGS